MYNILDIINTNLIKSKRWSFQQSSKFITRIASQQIGEHPLTKGLNLEGELFIADLSYIAALN